MRIMNTTELSAMEVINLCDGARLGCPAGLEITVGEGKVSAIIIPRECGLFSLGKGERYRVPWCRVECVGEDTVLVKLTPDELAGCIEGGRGKRR